MALDFQLFGLASVALVFPFLDLQKGGGLITNWTVCESKGGHPSTRKACRRSDLLLKHV